MNRELAKSCALALVPSIVTLLLVQACGGSSDAVAQSAAADPAEGVWETVATVRNCTTNEAITTFRGSQVMHRGGTLSDTHAGAPSTRGPGWGVWSRNADGTYAVKFRFYRFNTDGSLAGTNVVSSTRTLSADGKGYTAVTRGEVRDTSGNVLQTTCVTDVGTRFE